MSDSDKRRVEGFLAEQIENAQHAEVPCGAVSPIGSLLSLAIPERQA